MSSCWASACSSSCSVSSFAAICSGARIYTHSHAHSRKYVSVDALKSHRLLISSMWQPLNRRPTVLLWGHFSTHHFICFNEVNVWVHINLYKHVMFNKTCYSEHIYIYIYIMIPRKMHALICCFSIATVWSYLYHVPWSIEAKLAFMVNH